jgi:inner membrane transporter RhtA
MFSVQAGAGFAKFLFDDLTATGVVFLRVFLAAIVLLILTRPNVRQLNAKQWRAIAIFGVTMAGMNYTYYLSLERLPLGLAVTIEFVGPLAVALWHSRKPLDVVWVILAASGLALLNPFTGHVDGLGVVLALIAGAFWGTYIVLGQKLGQVMPGAQGLGVSLVIASICLFPLGISGASHAFFEPWLLLAALGVAVFSSVIPYTLEIEALRRMDTRLFGILMSMEPAVGAVIGFILLSESLLPLQILAMVLVTMASYGAVRFAKN